MRRVTITMLLFGLLLAACGGGAPADTPEAAVSDPNVPVDAAPVDEAPAPENVEVQPNEGDQEPAQVEEADPYLEAVRAMALDPCALTPEDVIEENRDVELGGELSAETTTDAETGAITGTCTYWGAYRLTVFVPGPEFDLEGAFYARVPENYTELDDIRGPRFWGFDSRTLYALRDGFWITIETLDPADEKPLIVPTNLLTIAERRFPSK